MLMDITKTEIEYPIIRKLQQSIEARYIDGHPPHHHISAWEKGYDHKSPPPSSIFVCNFEEFNKISAKEIQEIFHHRHILVLKVPLYDEGFTLDTLKMYANVHRTVDMVGKWLSFLYLQQDSDH